MINMMISSDRSHKDRRPGPAGLGSRAVMVKAERQGRPAPMGRTLKSERPGAMIVGVYD